MTIPPKDVALRRYFFGTRDNPSRIYWHRGRRRSIMFRGGGDGSRILGICAVALGAGILIAAIFPVGALLFLVAFLLIACGCACCRR